MHEKWKHHGHVKGIIFAFVSDKAIFFLFFPFLFLMEKKVSLPRSSAKGASTDAIKIP
jgi:hypothetical protein